MPHLTLLVLILTPVATGLAPTGPLRPTPETHHTACARVRPRRLGLANRPLSLSEMVLELERGCLALEDVRFRPGEDTIESISPAQFAQVARAIGLAQGAYRVTVPPEQTAGLGPDTVQARRRGTRLRDELVHYGASSSRLRDDLGWPNTAAAVARGTAVPMLVRVPEL